MKLIVYGDSFAGPANRFDDPLAFSWTNLLAKKLNIELVNNAVAGSSVEYSVNKFIKDCLSCDIKKHDIIVFIISHPGRLHLDYQNNHPKTATQYQEYYHKTRGIILDSWYLLNKDYIKWYEKHKDLELLGINSCAYTHMFQSYAKNNSSNIFTLINSFPNKEYIPIVDKSKNFIYPDINLYDACEAEFYNFKYQDWVKYVKSDPRANHFSNINLEKLADSIYKAIINKDSSHISYDSFKKDLFNAPLNNLKIYQNYVEKKLLFKSNKYEEVLKKVLGDCHE